MVDGATSGDPCPPSQRACRVWFGPGSPTSPVACHYPETAAGRLSSRTVGGGEKNIQSSPRYSGHGLPLGPETASAGRLSRPVPVAPVVRGWVGEKYSLFTPKLRPHGPARVLAGGRRKKSTLSLASHSSRGWSRAERLRRLYYLLKKLTVGKKQLNDVKIAA